MKKCESQQSIFCPQFACLNPDTTGTLSIPVKNVKKGHYLVRVQVDGAESELIVDIDDTSPTFHKYIRPEVEIK